MDLVWEYLNRVAEDAAPTCRSKDPPNCRVHGNHGKDLKYVFEVWGVNSVREEVSTTAPSFMKAINNARYHGANQITRLMNDVNVQLKTVNGEPAKKNVIIPGDENLQSERIRGLDVGIQRHFSGSGDSRPHAGVGGGADGDKDRSSDAHGAGTESVPGEVPQEQGDGPDERLQDGGDPVGRLTQGTFQFDEAKGKVLKYLKLAMPDADADTEDAWVDSGDGNFAWKRSRRKTPFDRLPKARIREIIADNVALIKSIDADMLQDVASRIYRVLSGKLDPHKFVDWLEDKCDVSEARAYLIAIDQIRKAKERIKVEDWINRGIEFAVWRHNASSNDPREYHKRFWDGRSGLKTGMPNGLNGFPFRLSDPPVIDEKTGERGLPSQLIGCKCYISGVKGT